jgi:hypothetical protein
MGRARQGAPAIHWDLRFVGVLAFLGGLGTAAGNVAWFKEARSCPLYRLAGAAIALSRATLRNIRQNLAWAFGYNFVLVPLAMIGVVQPMFAALAMACSSVSVVGNALRLRRRGLPAPRAALASASQMA